MGRGVEAVKWAGINVPDTYISNPSVLLQIYIENTYIFLHLLITSISGI